MSEMEKKLKVAREWAQQNFKSVLLVLNALVAVVLLFFIASHAIFELRVHALVKNAIAIETSKAKSTSQETSTSSGRRPEGRPDRRSDVNRQGGSQPESPSSKKPLETAATSGTQPSEKATTTPADSVRPSTGTLVADGPSSGSAATSTSLSAHSEPTSGTMATSQSAVAMSDTATSKSEASSTTVVAAQGDTGEDAKESDSRPHGSNEPNPGSEKKSESEKTPEQIAKEEKDAVFKKIAQRALFGGPKPAVHNPVFDGVLGDQAMIDNKWVKVGEKVGSWEVASLTASTVVLKNDEGEEKTLSLGTHSSAGGPSRPSSPSGGGGQTSPQNTESSDSSERPGRSRGSDDGSGGPSSGGRFDLSQVPDDALERLTRPGMPLEGMSVGEIRSMDPDQLRQLFEARREQMRGMRGSGRRGGRL